MDSTCIINIVRQVVRALKILFTPVINNLLTWLEMGMLLIIQMNYFSNIYKILINIINWQQKCYFKNRKNCKRCSSHTHTQKFKMGAPLYKVCNHWVTVTGTVSDKVQKHNSFNTSVTCSLSLQAGVG